MNTLINLFSINNIRYFIPPFLVLYIAFGHTLSADTSYDSLSVPRIRINTPLELPDEYFQGPGAGLESIMGIVKPPVFDIGETIVGGEARSVTILVYRSGFMDPGPGGYWIFLSANRGEKWAPPLYTGMGAGEPVTLKSTVHFPIVQSGAILLEGEITAADSPDGRVRKNLLINLPLRKLKADADNDGLTDLIEERLLTDPMDKDTDDDWVPDGTDSCPLNARPPEDDLDHIRDAALRWLIRKSEYPWTRSAKSGGMLIIELDEKTNPHYFTHNPARIIWLSKPDIKRYESKFGQRDIFIFGRVQINGKGALVKWSYGKQTGTIKLSRTDKKWVKMGSSLNY